MTESAATLVGGTALLERAVGYTLGALRLVTPDSLANPTPCTAWDLRDLLAHMNDSLAAVQEAADLGDVLLEGRALRPDPRVDPVGALRDRACGMIGAWTKQGDSGGVRVGG